MELGQGLHEKDVWSEFGDPASKQSKVIASTVFVPFFCSVTLKTRSRSVIIELGQGLHQRDVWCEFVILPQNSAKLLRVQCSAHFSAL